MIGEPQGGPLAGAQGDAGPGAAAAPGLVDAVFANAGVGLCVLDPCGRVLRANESWLRMAGLTREAAVGADFWTLFPSSPVPLRELHDRVREGRSIHVPEHPQSVDGRDAWYEALLAPVAVAGGTGILITAWDVTERRRVEQALRHGEARYRTVFENTCEALTTYRVVRDARGGLADLVVEDMNPAAEAMAGRPLSQLVGRSLYELFGRESVVAGFSENADAVARTGRPTVFESFSDNRWFLNSAFRLDAETIAVGSVEITAHKRAEEALRDADRRKNDFLAVLSHELRNPLAPIRNAVHLLEHAAPGGPQAARARDVIRRQTDHLTRLVDELLDVTRISRGKVELRRARLDVRDVMRRTCDDHRATFEQAQVALRLDLPAGPVFIDADATRMSQVLGNLLSNAVKFTHAGGAVDVELDVRGGDAVIRVRDDGVGIRPDQLPRMFVPFAQGEQGLARTRGGLGLGLALVKSLVELHGGFVRAASDGPGTGAEFVVALPLADEPAARGAAPASPRPARPRSVLVIEDNVDAARTLADVLELAGHRVVIASDGRSGIALAREVRPDVVLCDLGLPDVSGYEVARALRADPALRSARLVAVSGYTQEEDRERARRAGFDAHVPKPPPLEELERLLEWGA